MESKQTAVMTIAKAFRDWQKEWDLYNFVHGAPKPKTYEEFIEEFLQMEKEQIIEAHYEGQCNNQEGYPKYISQQYYNKTYGNKLTAVEWLHEIAKQREPDKFDWEQAKQIEKVNILELIAFMRNQDKMGKSIQDLYEQYINER